MNNLSIQCFRGRIKLSFEIVKYLKFVVRNDHDESVIFVFFVKYHIF